MTVSHTPAPARSDARPESATAAADRAVRRPYRRHGLALAAGAGLWSLSMAVFGLEPPEASVSAFVAHGSSLLFQVGLLFLVRVLWLTRALGAGRVARAVLRVEAAAIALAMGGSTIPSMVGSGDVSQPVWALLDAFWPISMLGMFFIGIRIAIAGRWTGISRYWPMVAESWAVVTIPSLMLGGPTVGLVVACTHLLVGYVTLGVIVSRKQR